MEEIVDVSDLFLDDLNIDINNENKQDKQKDKTKSGAGAFSPRQVGSITKFIEPIDTTASLSAIDELFKNSPELTALPIKEDDRVIGIIERAEAEAATKEAIRKFDTRSAAFGMRVEETDFTVGNYTHRLDDAIVTLDSNDYIEKDLQKITDINKAHNISDFLVFDSKGSSRKFIGLANLNDFLSRITEIRERDLEKASIVQNSQFPSEDDFLKLPYKVTAWNRMANTLGGDAYQVMQINENESVVAIFDVSGKNVAAALLTVILTSFFKILSTNVFRLPNNPVFLVSLLDKYISSLVVEGTFVTGVICYIDVKKNVIYIFNCGHTTVYLTYGGKSSDTKMTSVNSTLPPFGMGAIVETLAKKKSGTYNTFKLRDDFHIGMYSDGLTDMYNKRFEEFGEDGAKNFFRSLYSVPDNRLRHKISQIIDNYTEDTIIPDDITVLDIRM